MIGQPLAGKGGRALAGLALCLWVAACGNGDDARGPAAASLGEEAALNDARAMLDERTPPQETPSGEPAAADGIE